MDRPLTDDEAAHLINVIHNTETCPVCALEDDNCPMCDGEGFVWLDRGQRDDMERNEHGHV